MIASMLIIAMAISIIPSYAYAPNYINITFIDTTDNNKTFTYNINNEWGNIGYIIFDYDQSGYLQISVAPSINDLDGTSTIYKMWLPNNKYAIVEAYASGDDTVTGTLGNTETGAETIEGSLTPDSTHPNITIRIEIHGDTLYTQSQYNQYGQSQYDLGYQNGEADGELEVLNNLDRYNLYTSNQYLLHGSQEYVRGKNDGKAEGYNEGLQEGVKTNKTLIGLANVGITGISLAFNQFMTSAGIFGTSLISIVASAVIIFIVYVIFKAVRS